MYWIMDLLVPYLACWYLVEYMRIYIAKLQYIRHIDVYVEISGKGWKYSYS
jgi:hypothetical protein